MAVDSSQERRLRAVASLDVDWRFLLPSRAGGYERVLLLGAAPATVAKVAATALARELVQEPSGPRADAVFCRAGSARSDRAICPQARP